MSPALLDGQQQEPLEFLELVMNDPATPLRDRIRAAVAAAQYVHTKRHDGGKREEEARDLVKDLDASDWADVLPLRRRDMQ